MLISGMQIYTLSQVSVSITLIIMMVTVVYHSSVVVKKAINCNLTPLSTIYYESLLSNQSVMIPLMLN